MKIQNILYRYIFSHPLYRWYIGFPRLNRRHARTLAPFYVDYSEEKKTEGIHQKTLVCVMNGNFEAGGLADRLRSLVSAYQLCKENNLQFRILFTSPFLLEDYLVPNKYNWSTSEDKVHFDKSTEVICCEITDDTTFQSKKVHDFLTKRIQQSTAAEIHLYGNPSFCYNEGTYSALFNELFRPSPGLQKAIQDEHIAIGKPFIAIQLRFTKLLGDIQDFGEELPKEEKQKLISNCINRIEQLRKTLDKHLATLVTSDSSTFLRAVKAGMPDVYIIKGGVVHIDYCSGDNRDAYRKLFVEFFLMTQAQHIYRLRTKGMRWSGLPYSSSLLSNVPLTDIEF